MKTLEIHYPETLPDSMNLSLGEMERELKMALAVKLFELGRLSSGQAAQMASTSRYQFLHSLSDYRVNALGWDSSEFDVEIANA